MAKSKTESKHADGVCPHCGYCPHCGRGYQTLPYYPLPYYPQPYWPWELTAPSWPYYTQIWCGDTGTATTTGVTSGNITSSSGSIYNA